MTSYYQENREKILENCRIYNAINYDKIREYQRNYYHRKKQEKKNNSVKNENYKKDIGLPKKRYYSVNKWKDNKHLLPTAEIKEIDNGKKVFIINFD